MTNIQPTAVGHVQALYRYPVKGMRGEPLTQAQLGWYGFEGDRRYAFVRADQAHSGFPWLTPRQLPQMLHYVARFQQPEAVANSGIEVETPSGQRWPIRSAELLAEFTALYGRGVHIMRLKRGLFDSFPLSLMSAASADGLSQSYGQPVDWRRFRQNILLHTVDPTPFLEENWLSAALTFGHPVDGPRIRLNRKIERCVVITLDPDVPGKSSDLLAHVAKTRANCVGVHATPERLGPISVGDPVYLSSL